MFAEEGEKKTYGKSSKSKRQNIEIEKEAYSVTVVLLFNL